MNGLILAIILTVAFLAYMIHCPIFKPWFGFRKPEGHKGKWFE